MNKLVSLPIALLAAIFTLAFTACGDDSDSTNRSEIEYEVRYDTVYVNDTTFRIDTLINELTKYDTLKKVDTLVLVDSVQGMIVVNNDTIYFRDTTYVTDSVEYKRLISFKDMDTCFANWEGYKVYVSSVNSVYVCKDGVWAPDDYKVNGCEVSGVAQKGPFQFQSPIYLREAINDSLEFSTQVIVDEVSGDHGEFVIPGVYLKNPIVSLEAKGLYKNEVKGVWSTKEMTLQALAELPTNSIDVENAEASVNVNLLTHLEYDRVLKLVRKGYSLKAAKKQAQQEIMHALGLDNAVSNAEKLDIDNDGMLLAVSLLFLRNASDDAIASNISTFRSDIAADGVWSNSVLKTIMADWAYNFDKNVVNASIDGWNLSQTANFSNVLNQFWRNAYGIGECSAARSGVLMKNQDSTSKNKDLYLICRYNGVAYWDSATTREKDTYKWGEGDSTEVRQGSVTDSFYVYYKDANFWYFDSTMDAFMKCVDGTDGLIKYANKRYMICDGDELREATVFEYDTYQWNPGKDGSTKKGNVTNTVYVYDTDAKVWRAAEGSGVESTFGVCSEGYDKVVKSYVTSLGSRKYYICDSKEWRVATALEYDTYQWAAGTEGSVKVGDVNTSNYYVYDTDSSAWRAAVGGYERYVGACTGKSEGIIKYISAYDKYYKCTERSWIVATALEYDTYQWEPGDDGDVKTGSVNSSNYYVYDSDISDWRAVSALAERYFGACTDAREGIYKKDLDFGTSIYKCGDRKWSAVTDLEGDTHGWAAGEDGDVKTGNFNTSAYYVYDSDSSGWRAAKTTYERYFGACTEGYEGTIKKNTDYSSFYYYKCSSHSWVTATAVEYDTYGWDAGVDGEIKPGNVNTSTYYVYDSDISGWRVAADIIEKNIGACTDAREGFTDTYNDRDYSCSNKSWKIVLKSNEFMDSRDGTIYRFATIGTQTWMAENLRYVDSATTTSFKGGRAKCDDTYGCYYTWSAVMDSVKSGCGYYGSCSITTPYQGICPDGWHVPSTKEFETLFSYASYNTLKSTTWYSSGTDPYGMSILPGGYYYDRTYTSKSGVGSYAYFWTSGNYNSYYAYDRYVYSSGSSYTNRYKYYQYNLRCIKDSK